MKKEKKQTLTKLKSKITKTFNFPKFQTLYFYNLLKFK